MDGGQVHGKEGAIQSSVAALERHIQQMRASDASAPVYVSWLDFLQIYCLDPNDPEHFRLIFEAAEARRDIIVMQRGEGIFFRQLAPICR
jgi:hypothetical protein